MPALLCVTSSHVHGRGLGGLLSPSPRRETCIVVAPSRRPTPAALPSCNAPRGSPTPAFFRDAGATALVTAGAYSLVRSFDVLTNRNLVEQKLSRKLVHVLSGLLFLSSWPIFSDCFEARYFAALVPLFNCVRLLVYGFSLVTDESLVKSVTREGKPEELLKGPLYYVVVLMFCAVVFWRDSPIGVTSLSMMSAGDGFADIMGRRFGGVKLPYNQRKSWVGSISMFVSGFIFSMLMLHYFTTLGYLKFEWNGTAGKVALISLAATFVESLPITEFVDDNVVVPLTSVLVTVLLFGYFPPH